MFKTSEIKFEVTVDEDKVPEQIQWSATDAGQPGLHETKSIMLSIWDHNDQSTLRIDLWTKEMPIDEMKQFFHETFMGMAATYERASGDEEASGMIKAFAREFGHKVELLKK
jgi:gliding motility-associated protein GldC